MLVVIERHRVIIAGRVPTVASGVIIPVRRRVVAVKVGRVPVLGRRAVSTPAHACQDPRKLFDVLVVVGWNKVELLGIQFNEAVVPKFEKADGK